jgi:surface protein
MRFKKLLVLALFVLGFMISCSKEDNGLNKGAPEIENQTFTSPEAITHTDVIGTITATDPNGDALKFKLGTDPSGLFEVSESGQVSLKEWQNLNYEVSKEHSFNVTATDGSGVYYGIITVVVTDSENEAPIMIKQTFRPLEDIMDTDIIGVVAITDVDPITISLLNNDNDLFEINQTGEVKLAQGKSLDYERRTEHKIEIGVTDGVYKVAKEMIIAVKDLWEPGDLILDWESFTTTWATESDFEKVVITLDQKLKYDFRIDWGDGTLETITESQDLEHIYAKAGTYVVSMKGQIPSLKVLSSTSLLNIDQWGTNPWLAVSFNDCPNLASTAVDKPNLSLTESTAKMFYNCPQFNGNVSQWDVSNVTDMEAMFYNATAFDQNLGDWNIGEVANIKDLLFQTGLSQANYETTLIGWSNLADELEDKIDGLDLGDLSGLTYCNEEAISARENLINTHGWTIAGDTQQCE